MLLYFIGKVNCRCGVEFSQGADDRVTFFGFWSQVRWQKKGLWLACRAEIALSVGDHAGLYGVFAAHAGLIFAAING